jgi:hypothetical protein
MFSGFIFCALFIDNLKYTVIPLNRKHFILLVLPTILRNNIYIYIYIYAANKLAIYTERRKKPIVYVVQKIAGDRRITAS